MYSLQNLWTHVVEGAMAGLDVGRAATRRDAVAENYTVISSSFPTVGEPIHFPFRI